MAITPSKPIFCATHPRACSTAFERVNHPPKKPLNEGPVLLTLPGFCIPRQDGEHAFVRRRPSKNRNKVQGPELWEQPGEWC